MNMNLLALNLDNYNAKNFYYLEPKKNMIMNGIFTKFIYTDPYFTMNEVFFYIPIQYTYIDFNNDNDYYTVFFDISQVQNASIIEKLNKLETEVLYHYAIFMNRRKCTSRIIVHKLTQGSLKIRKTKDHKPGDPPKHFLLKISGIWEADATYGLTSKFVEGTAN